MTGCHVSLLNYIVTKEFSSETFLGIPKERVSGSSFLFFKGFKNYYYLFLENLKQTPTVLNKQIRRATSPKSPRPQVDLKYLSKDGNPVLAGVHYGKEQLSGYYCL